MNNKKVSYSGMSINKKVFLALLLLGITWALLACGGFNGSENPVATTVPATQPTSTEIPFSSTPLPTGEPTPAGPQPSAYLPLDDTWFQYTNYRMGFTIKIPNKLYYFYGACEWREEGGDHSYRYHPALVPVKVFEDGTTTFIASEYYYELDGETVEEGVHYFSECNAVTNRVDLLHDPGDFQQAHWEIVMQEVFDDNQLDAFIKARYGGGCSLGEKTPWDLQDGVYDVHILRDDKPMETTECPLNYATVLKYYPADHRVISWNLGQVWTFVGDEELTVIYDQEMHDSFRFLTVED